MGLINAGQRERFVVSSLAEKWYWNILWKNINQEQKNVIKLSYYILRRTTIRNIQQVISRQKPQNTKKNSLRSAKLTQFLNIHWATEPHDFKWSNIFGWLYHLSMTSSSPLCFHLLRQWSAQSLCGGWWLNYKTLPCTWDGSKWVQSAEMNWIFRESEKMCCVVVKKSTQKRCQLQPLKCTQRVMYAGRKREEINALGKRKIKHV